MNNDLNFKEQKDGPPFGDSSTTTTIKTQSNNAILMEYDDSSNENTYKSGWQVEADLDDGGYGSSSNTSSNNGLTGNYMITGSGNSDTLPVLSFRIAKRHVYN